MYFVLLDPNRQINFRFCERFDSYHEALEYVENNAPNYNGHSTYFYRIEKLGESKGYTFLTQNVIKKQGIIFKKEHSLLKTAQNSH